MKIEIPCQNCQSLLRLPAEHVGKKARCPVCGALVDIIPPSADAPTGVWNRPLPSQSHTSAGESDAGAQTTGDSGRTGEWEPQPTTPGFDYQSPVQPTQPGMAPHTFSSSTQDGFWVTGLVLGIISVVFACGCGICGSWISFGTGIAGLTATMFSRSPNRWICVCLNLFGMVVGAIVALFFVLSLTFS